MSKRRIPDSERKTRSAAVSPAGERVRFLGLALSGGKADKASLAVVDYYPKHRKVFLSKLVDQIRNEPDFSADTRICELVEQFSEDAVSLSLDVPWRLPTSLRHANSRVGIETSKEPHVLWMWEHYRKINKKKKPKRIFTPYTERCVEMYVASELEEPFILNQALGANNAPLLARAAHLERRLKIPLIEVAPKISLWRIGRSLNIMKSHLRFHRHAVGGDEARKAILENLAQNNVVFLYAQDQKAMVENNHAFEAFITALTGFLKYKKLTEPRPTGFPEDEDWIEFPVPEIRWKEI
ncbi:MAG: DUF429 domain-containing protein [Bdellovibrionaceae bacterium]|nr:DUF429 domain-containing protein [Pseudobdellovibrionaceae bacterium]